MRAARFFAALAALGLLSAVAASAHAQTTPGAAPSETPQGYPADAYPATPPPPAMAPRYTPPQVVVEQPPAPPTKAVQYRWGAEIGARSVRLSRSGYEPYTSGETLSGFLLGAHYGFFNQGPVSLLLAGDWSVTSSDGRAREQPASLLVHRFAAGLLARYQATRWLYPAVRVLPFFQYARAELTPDQSPSRYDARAFAGGVDATAGLHFVPFTIGDVDWPKARVWVFAEAGWSLATASEMTFKAHQDPDDPRRPGELHLPDLRTSGYLFRVSAAVSF